jgi:DNA-binding CsgD family transcriptional regulator
MASEIEILTGLFAAAMSTNEAEMLWLDFLTHLAEVSQAESALLQVDWWGASASCWQVGTPCAAPDATTIERMRTGRVYSQIDLPVLAAAGPDAPAGMLRALKLRIGQDGTALLMLQRDRPDFRAMDGVQLSNLIPHLGLALKGWRQLGRQRAEAALDRQLCRDLGLGWVVFAPSGRVLGMAPEMADRLVTTAGLYLRADDRLFAPTGDAAQALHSGLAAATLQEARPQFVELSRAPRVQMVITAEWLAGEQVLVGRLRHGLCARDLPLEQLASRFGLSRSEARLAAHLCDGFSLKEAAEVFGWTLETARSCSKQIYAKMGASGQTDVLRRMLMDVIWLMPAE